MTPFQAAGYTKDSKFKVLAIGGASYSPFKVGDVISLCYDDGSSSPKFVNQEGIKDYFLLPASNSTIMKCKLINEQTSYPNPPHKHADIIHAWADGAEIECWRKSCGDCPAQWIKLSSPAWLVTAKYRVKPVEPSKSQKQSEKEALQEQLAKIEQETATLKQQLSKLGD